MCRPEVIANTATPFLRVEAGRHPCVVHTYMGDDYIPNDTYINDSQVRWDSKGTCLLQFVCVCVLQFGVHAYMFGCESQ